MGVNKTKKIELTILNSQRTEDVGDVMYFGYSMEKRLSSTP